MREGWAEMKKRLLFLLILVTVVSMVAILAACGEEETTTTSATTAEIAKSALQNPQGYPADPAATPVAGGTMKMILGMTLGNFGAPWDHMPGPNAYICRAVCEGLVTIDADGNRSPCLATEWKTDANAKTYTFTLREGVKFQDGTDFNAEAVKWNLEKGKSAGVGALQNVASVEAVDAKTVRVTLTNWDPIFLESLGDSGMQVSPAAYELYGDDIKTHPVGTGPFMFKDFVPDVSIDLVAYPDYWQEGLPYLDGIHVEMVTDATVRFAAFMNGECDYLEGASGAQVKEAEAAGYESLFMVSGVMGITWDSTSADSPFSKLEVRRAIAMAAPYDTIIEDVFSGMYYTTNQFAGKIGDKELQAWDSSIKGYKYDEAAALALLEEAGYGLAKPIDVTLTYQTNAENDDMFTAIQAALAKVGVNIKLNGLDNVGWGDYITKQAPGEMCGLQTSYQLPLPYVSTLSQALSKGSGWFPLQFIPDEYDALYQQMVAETDQAKKADLYKQLNKMAVDKYCIALPLYLRTNYKLIGANLHDMGAGQWTGEFDPSIIWLSK
jgi:peptide/nickel transport system substrate-binding protein